MRGKKRFPIEFERAFTTADMKKDHEDGGLGNGFSLFACGAVTGFVNTTGKSREILD
jgi:hypothetical protein